MKLYLSVMTSCKLVGAFSNEALFVGDDVMQTSWSFQ